MFSIDDRKLNGFYHYNLSDSAGGNSAGWGCYTTWGNANQRRAWLDAVKKYNKDNGIKHSGDEIKARIQDIRELFKTEDKKFPDKKSLIMPGLGEALKLLKLTGDADTDEVISKLLEPLGGSLPTPMAMLKYAWSSTQFNIRLEISKKLEGMKELGVDSLLNPVLDLGDEIVDQYLIQASLIEKETRTHARKAYKAYAKAYELSDTDPEKSKEYMEQFHKEMDEIERKYGPDVRDAAYQCLCIDELLSVFSLFRNFQNTDTKVWTTIVYTMSFLTNVDITAYASDKLSALRQLMKDLLTLLAALAGAFIAQKCAEEQEMSVDEQGVASCLGTTPDKILDTVDKNAKDEQNRLAGEFNIYKEALKNEDGYSLENPAEDLPISVPRNLLSGEPQANIMDKEFDCNCAISICDYDPGTDIEGFIQKVSTLNPEEAVIEFSSGLKCRLTASVGQKVKTNDVIAYISGVPVRSQFDFTVTEASTNYIVGTYDKPLVETINDDVNEDTAQQLVGNLEQETNAYNEDSYNEIVGKFNDLSRADDFIRDYISYFRFPELAQYTREHVKGNAVEISSKEFVDEYESYADDYKDRYIEKVKTLSSKKHLQPLLKAGRLARIKKERDDAKAAFLNDILTLYGSNPGNIKFCSKGRICDFLLYNMYVDYITGDRFDYDEDNPYIVRLSNALDRIVARRVRLELNMENAQGLIRNFNELCDQYIKRYWPFKGIDYHTKLSELFQYDYYLDTADIKKSEKTDGALSMYKRVLKYLKALCKFTPDDDEGIEFTENTDINKLLEEQGKRSADSTYNKKKIKLERALKNIAYRFCSLRSIEQSMKEISITDYITDKELKDFYYMKKVVGNEVMEYKEGTKYSQYLYVPEEGSEEGPVTNVLYGKESVLGAYIKMLKTITADDANILREIVTDVLGWYTNNAKSIEDLSMFEQFRQIEWTSPMMIYHNGNPTDYYMFDDSSEPEGSTIQDLMKIEESLPPIDENGTSPEDMDFYPKTKARSNKIPYWLRYCAMASLVNLMLPVYWSTGLIIAGSPVKLPIIYIPIVVINGRVTVVMGIGICGLCIFPMMLFANIGDINGSLLIPINILVDATIKKMRGLGNLQMKSIESILKPMVTALDKEIQSTEKDMEDVDYQIQEIKSIQDNPKARRSLDKNTK